MVSPLIEALFPADCPGCERPLPGLNRGGLCAPCWSEIKPAVSPLCPCCGITVPFFLGDESAVDRPCGRCLDDPPVFDGARCALVYEGPVRTLVHLFKFDQRRDLARFFAASILEALPSRESFDLIVPVPLHWSRRWKRGFNQAALLARALGRAKQTRVATRLLTKRRRTPDQAGLDASQRRRNLMGAFAMRSSSAHLDGLHVLLIDDVLTTGATASACAHALKRAGAARVFVAAVARTPLKPDGDDGPKPAGGNRKVPERP